MILEMEVGCLRSKRFSQFDESEIVSRYQADCSASKQTSNNGFCSYGSIVRVGSVQNLIEKKQYGHAAGEIHDAAQSLDLRIEPRRSLLKRIDHADRRTDCQNRYTHSLRPDRCA